MTFELSVSDVENFTTRMFYEYPEGAAESLNHPLATEEFKEICREVIAGKPLRPAVLPVTLEEIRKTYPQADITKLSFTGFEREVTLADARNN